MKRLTTTLAIENSTVHDLRRTVGTNLARLGVSKDIRARVLNHVDGARSVTDAVYNQHELAAQKGAALVLWETDIVGDGASTDFESAVRGCPACLWVSAMPSLDILAIVTANRFRSTPTLRHIRPNYALLLTPQ